MKPSSPAHVTVAVAQMGPAAAVPASNRKRTVELIAKAANRGAQLVVLPELCTSQYVLPTRAEALAVAETLDGATIQAWAEAARRHQVHVVGGLVERSGEQLFNSAAVVGPGGLVGVYRKNHLWGYEHDVFTRGDLGFPVWDLPFGRLGALICFDLRFPESTRLLALQGADIICVPTAWSTAGKVPYDRHGYTPGNHMVIAQAYSNRVAIACSDRVGQEGSATYLGKSLIVSPAGTVLAGPASRSRPAVALASFDLATARDKSHGPKSDLFGGRRTDLYDAMLGYRR